jgi:hypothetical protein
MKTSVKSVLAACVVASASPAAADLVANGGFEQGYPGGSSQQVDGVHTFLSGWTVSDNTLTWYENGFNLNQIAITAHSGDLAVNLADVQSDGSVRFVTVSQTINTLPFQEYQVSYWVGNYSANAGPATVSVTVRDGTSNTIILPEQPGTAPPTNQASTWQRFSFAFIADGTSNTIFLTGADGPSYVGLDDVSVAAVPEPSTWVLALVGFAGLGLAGLGRARRMTPA